MNEGDIALNYSDITLLRETSSQLDDFKFVKEFYKWAENKNLLSDYGEVSYTSLNTSSKVNLEDFNDIGKQLVKNYYDKWYVSRTSNTINYNETKKFWDNRLNDIKKINKQQTLIESSFNYNCKNFDNIYTYMESLDYNIPKNAAKVVIDSEYHNHYLMINECKVYDIDGLYITEGTENLNTLARNEQVYKIPIKESSDLREATKEIMRALKTFKEDWNSEERLSDVIPVELHFDEFNFAVRL